MTRFFHIFFNKNSSIAKIIFCLPACILNCIFQFIFRMDYSHPFASTSCRGFYQKRKRDFFCCFHQSGLISGFCFSHRNSELFYKLSGFYLVAHQFNGSGMWSDKYDVILFAGSNKSRIFGQKTVSRMDGFTFRTFGNLYYPFDIKICIT